MVLLMFDKQQGLQGKAQLEEKLSLQELICMHEQ